MDTLCGDRVCDCSRGLLGLSTFEWIAVILCIGAVLAAEGVNSAIEALCDKVSPEYDEAIKHTKDLAAGAVLILAVMSIIVGLLILFLRYYLSFIEYVSSNCRVYMFAPFICVSCWGRGFESGTKSR